MSFCKAFTATFAVGLLAAPLAAVAQGQPRVSRIGVLRPGSPMGADVVLEAFRQELKALGYFQGQNVLLEARYAEGNLDRLPHLATELVQLKVDVIVVSSGVAIKAVQQATTTIPVVMAVSSDPVADGFVASLARPGGNITGLSMLALELSGKRLQLLKETVPKASRVAVMWNPASSSMEARYRVVQAGAPQVGVTVRSLEVREPRDFENAFATMTRERPDALLLLVDPVTLENSRRIVTFAAAKRLPAIYEVREFVDAGGLMSYGPSLTGMWRRAATYVDKILKGTKPADLPVEQPTRFELIINMKTARALGLTIPRTVLIRADHAIQ